MRHVDSIEYVQVQELLDKIRELHDEIQKDINGIKKRIDKIESQLNLTHHVRT